MKLHFPTSHIAAFLLLAILIPPTASANESDASEIFMAGFNAYHKKDYAGSVAQMETVLKKYPKSPLRDMALFWLAKGHYKKGDRLEGAKLMAQFLRDYPASSLKAAVEEELRTLAALYEKGEPLPPPRDPPKPSADKATSAGK